MIQVKNITKTYSLTKKQKKERQSVTGSISAVNNISFECQPGKVFSLLGPNGAGKTTMLRMIATILKPTTGSISVNGSDVVENSLEVRKCIGFLTGSTNLYEKLTPIEIVSYFGELYGMHKKEIQNKTDELFTMLNIHEYSKKYIGQLSTGMKQKVSIARSIIHDPQVIIFDEPTSGLDVISANSIIELIRDYKEKGKTVVFSSHIMSEVDLLCDDVAIIAYGNLVYNGSIEDFRALAKNKSLTQLFIETVNANKNIRV